MYVEDVMTKTVACCDAADSLEYAAQLMWTTDCGSLPVCSHQDGRHHAIGMITDRDICMSALFEHKPLASVKVGEAMAKQLLSCQPNDRLRDAERTMRETRVRRLPVLDGSGSLIGMITLSDLARRATEDFHDRSEVDVKDTLATICKPRDFNAAAS
jgi:CBS domain-containing protein